MRNIRLIIEYDGWGYYGWQRQKNAKGKTIQEVIEGVLSRILQEKVSLIASGRTDAGVHALAQMANFKTESAIALSKLRLALNGNLPQDIVVKRIDEAPLDFHSRYSCHSKTYRYLILNRSYPSALWRTRAYFYRNPLDIELMRKESRLFLGKHDFTSFSSTDSPVRDKIRCIKRITVREDKGIAAIPCDARFISLEIEADGFLYNMVRNIVGTLIEVGRGKMPAASVKKILRAKDRRLAGPTAPAHGLYLVKVRY